MKLLEGIVKDVREFTTKNGNTMKTADIVLPNNEKINVMLNPRDNVSRGQKVSLDIVSDLSAYGRAKVIIDF